MRDAFALALLALVASSGCSGDDSELAVAAEATGPSPMSTGPGTAGTASSVDTPVVAPNPAPNDGAGPKLPADVDIIVDEPVVMDAPEEEKICGGASFARESVPTEVLLVVDRSGSLTDHNFEGTNIDRWEGLKPTLTQMVSSTMDRGVWWGLKFFPEDGGHRFPQCVPETIVPLIHSPLIEGGNGADVVKNLEATMADGDGTPTGQAMKFALEHLLEREKVSSYPKVMVLATDGEPNCKGPDGGGATDYAVEQIQAAFDAGYKTYVVGIDHGGRNLNRMALAGGVPRPDPRPPGAMPPPGDDDDREPRPGDIGYDAAYLATSPEEIQSVFEAITDQVASCVFELTSPPPVPDNIAVDFNAVRTERDPNRLNGWEYVSDDLAQIQVYGEWCERIRTEAGNTVTIKYGCPNIPIPPPR